MKKTAAKAGAADKKAEKKTEKADKADKAEKKSEEKADKAEKVIISPEIPDPGPILFPLLTSHA